ncbi:MAG: PAS domain S-box protein [Betaproteobacteria bacterium]|nr:PAS domain S-box protein [Betaproteobacteria bacterium]
MTGFAWAQQASASAAIPGNAPIWWFGCAIVALGVALVVAARSARLLDDKARFEAIVQSAMDAIITVDSGKRIVLFNDAAEQMFGCSRSEAIGEPLDRFIPERFRAAHSAHVERFARTGNTSRRMGLQSALWALRADGAEFPIEASISLAKAGGQKLLTVIIRDITERMTAAHELERAREQVRAGELRLNAIVQSAMDAIITVDSDQHIVLFNAAAEKMFGCGVAEATGGSLDRFIPQRMRASHRAHVDHFSRTGETSRRMGVRSILLALRADGTEFPIEASISQAVVGDQKLLTVILHDITERTRAEEEIRRANDELHELSLAMIEVRETERTRIARELHDELGQVLTALKMDVELFSGKIPQDRADLAEHVASMNRLLDSTVATTRRISSDLRPLVLDDLGLGAAAEWLIESLAQRAGIAFELKIDPSCADLGEPHASTLFRVMQESLTNVARHARATRVAVRLMRAGGDAVLTIADNGVGMKSDARAKPGSFGLRGIRERILLLGGVLSIVSEPSGGTTVSARLPMPITASRENA